MDVYPGSACDERKSFKNLKSSRKEAVALSVEFDRAKPLSRQISQGEARSGEALGICRCRSREARSWDMTSNGWRLGFRCSTTAKRLNVRSVTLRWTNWPG